MSRFDQIYDRRGTGAIKYDTLEHAGFGADALPLWVADMDFPAPECVGEALRRMTDPGIYGYTMTGTAYNAAVTGWFERRFGWKPEEDWLVTTPGVVYAICTAIRAFTEPGEAVMCLLPVYSHFFTAVEDNGRRPVYGHLKRENGHYEIDFEELERLLDEERPRLLILCSPHNPVGRVWKREELERLGRLCFDRGVLVVADEIHCDFVYPGQRHIPFLSLGPEFDAEYRLLHGPQQDLQSGGTAMLQYLYSQPCAARGLPAGDHGTGRLRRQFCRCGGLHGGLQRRRGLAGRAVGLSAGKLQFPAGLPGGQAAQADGRRTGGHLSGVGGRLRAEPL